jgi:hypothetical protein
MTRLFYLARLEENIKEVFYTLAVYPIDLIINFQE